MNSAVASSSVISRMPCSGSLGSLMKRSIFCGMRMSAFIALPSFVRDSCSAIEKPRLGMNGNGCAGSMASGVSSGNTWVRKCSSSQTRSAFLRSGAVDQHDADCRQRRAQFQPALLLVAGELRHRLADPRELLGGGEPVRALGRDALPHLTLEAGDAHHEEFVEVVGRDRQKAHPLQQRMVLVGGLLQHPPVEVQPGQFAIDEIVAAAPLDSASDADGAFVAISDRSDFINLCNSLCAICHRKGSLKGQIPNR